MPLGVFLNARCQNAQMLFQVKGTVYSLVLLVRKPNRTAFVYFDGARISTSKP